MVLLLLFWFLCRFRRSVDLSLEAENVFIGPLLVPLSLRREFRFAWEEVDDNDDDDDNEDDDDDDIELIVVVVDGEESEVNSNDDDNEEERCDVVAIL